MRSEVGPAEAAEFLARLWRGYARAYDEARAAYGTKTYLRQASLADDLGQLWVEEFRHPGANRCPSREAGH